MCTQTLHATALALQTNAGSANTQAECWSGILWSVGEVLYGVVPECHRSVSGMVSECIMSAKMVSLSASGTVSFFLDTL